ncbi:hypothetical protein HCN44_008170 [Aphidius gifuensis]|uniref:Nucleolar protein 6 n=1 Tax=Aphidius gifuensis TaxID=684658 RepID=A0A834XNW4_APHGI|nr:nucleolar protein 6 [Aphidius gifuensis]KAF7989496.1 hypothetical protein HCN44_008170 [Aphidius gifuensis]
MKKEIETVAMAPIDAKKRPLDDVEKTEIVQKKKFKKNKELFKPPTADELNQLRETENLFHSNLFRLQIEEILTEVKLKDKYVTKFNSWYPKLVKAIESIPETEDCDLSKQKQLSKLGVKVPKIDVPINEKGFYKFLKPSNISVIGSYSLGTTIGPNVIIDIMVEMPAKLFTKCDYQNYRYSRKRSIYLSYIAAHLDDSIVDEKKFIGDSWSPKLKLIPDGSLAKKVAVYIHLAAEKTSFNLSRFLPEKNSVRPEWLLKNEVKTEPVELPPTPHYNMMVLRDLIMSECNDKCIKMIKDYPNIRDGIILLKIWLNQRQSCDSSAAFNGHILTMLVLHLLSEKKLNTFMSSYQIVRNVWNILAQSDWTKKGITLATGDDCKTRVDDYHKYFDCVFVDVTGYHNMVSNLTKKNFEWFKSEAELAVKSLDHASIDSFQILFMRKLPFYSTFDQFICIHDTEMLANMAIEKITDNKKIDLGVDKRSKIVDLIIDTLSKALGNRVTHLFVEPESIKEWNTNESQPAGLNKIRIGIQLNSDYCFNPIEKGPEANQQEALEFREIWGDKSELRRFQDGNICEAVYWKKSQTIADKRMLTKQIITFILKSKFNITKNSYLYFGDQSDEYLQLKKTKITHFEYGTGEEATLLFLSAFNELEKDLTNLKNLPLSINSAQITSSINRYTSVFPPLSSTLKTENDCTINFNKKVQILNDNVIKSPQYVPSINVVIQLTTSGKWPDDLLALRKTKTAFYLEISNCLRKQCCVKTYVNDKNLIIYKSGYVFVVEIAQQKEIALIKKIDNNGVIEYKNNNESIKLEKKLFHLPKLSSALHGLHSQQPSFGVTCCLVKRWLSAHLLDDYHMPEIVVELLVAYMYLSPYPYRPAQIPQVGFLRFLQYFSREQWTTDPIIVNFNNEMTREEILNIENHFGTSRESGSLPDLFISTPYDHLTSIWTKNSPNKIILRRVSALAKETLKLVDVQFNEGSLFSWKPMFKPPTNEYDVLIYLKDEFNPRRYQSFDLDDTACVTKWHPYKQHTDEKIPIVEFDPVQYYLKELRNIYSDLALFFHDTYGGSIIGVLLKPSALEKKDFKITNINCRKLDNSNGKLVLNLAAIIEDFSIIGRDVVDKVEYQNKNL